MNTTAIIDIVCAVFVLILCGRRFFDRVRSRSNRLLNLCLIFILVTLFIDAAAYTFVGPEYSVPFRFFINYLSVFASCVNVFAFTLYTEALFSEKSPLNPWYFRILKILEIVWSFSTSYEFFAGHLLSYDVNGVENFDYTFPVYIVVMNLVILTYLPLVTIINGRKIGKHMTVVLCLCDLAPIITSMLYNLAGYDFTYSLGAVMLGMVSEFVQKDQTRFLKETLQKKEEQENANRILSENYTRILALEDSFEVLYDVELETGKYGIFSKGKSFREVSDNLENSNSFFDDVEKNLGFVHPEDRAGNYEVTRPQFIREALSEDDHFDRYYRLIVNGTPVWARMRIVYKDAEKKNIIIGVFNAEHDVETKQITEQKEQLQEALKRQETRLDQIRGLAAQFSVLYFVDLNSLETENYYLENDKTPEEAINIDRQSENFFDAFKSSMVVYAHPDFREELMKFSDPGFIRTLMKERRRYDYRFLCMDACGEYAWTDMVIMKFSNSETDDPVNIAVGYYNTDAEMRERLEFSRRQERDLEAIRGLANEYDTLYFVDMKADRYSKYYLTEDSPEAARTMADESQKFSDFHRQSMEAFCHPDFLKQMLRFSDLEYICDLLSDHNKYSCRFLCDSNNGYKWCEFVLIRLDKENIPERIAIGYTNIDEAVKTELEQKQVLNDALESAETANRAKTEFLFNMSHDIRTPMNAILGYTDIALHHIDEKDRVTDSLKKIRMSGGHLLSLINDILEMSRIEAGRLEIVNVPVNAYEVTEGIVNMAQALASTKDITFSAKIGELKNPYAYADELHTNQVIINLISNAIKYTEPGGRVDFIIEQTDEPENGIVLYRITVRDTGIGMSEEFQKHLFESFAREQSASVSKQEGAGLGLAIVKRIVDLTGGTISVQSRQGEGSTFVVELPLRIMSDGEIESFVNSEKRKTEAGDFSGLAGRKVLLVEDNEMNREISSEIMEEAGLVIDTAEDGAVAVRKVSENGPGYYDFILMDIQMPVMNGYEATAEIRRLPGGKNVPVIALSANAFEEDRRKSVEAGMNAHVAKPISIKELFETLARFV